MKLLFLHGWNSVPGGVKPTYLQDHGYQVLNPQLPDDDFAEAVRIAQAAFDAHQPQVVVGSSRGGAVALNINSGDAQLVLLCPAWKKWGTAQTMKPGTVILHSRADDVIPFSASEELVRNSGLLTSALIEVGTDHRLAEPEPLAAMLRACERGKRGMTDPVQHDYVLRGGDRGAERLRLLAAVKWPTTQQLLERAGLRAGMSCLDVGCGIGTVSLRMAEAVQPGGKVTGVDFDERCLGLARSEAKQLGLNVEFRTGSAGELPDHAAYDLVFGRFLLTHLLEPDQALARMARAARPGGVVVVEDIEFTGHFSYPRCAAFEQYVALYQEVVRHRGGDPNIGPRLVGMFLEAGLTDVEFEVIQPSYRQGPGKQIAAVTLEHIREAVVSAGLATDDEINRVVAEIKSFAEDPRTILSLPRIFQVWGKRAD